MPLLKKIRITTPEGLIKKYKLWGITLFKKEFTRDVTMWVVGIPVAKIRNKRHPSNIKNDTKNFVAILKQTKKKILWIDHSLGGGTEVYTMNSFKETPETTYLRLQYFPAYKAFMLTLHNTPQEAPPIFTQYKEILPFLKQFNFEEVVVNNLVGYPRTTDMLQLVAEYKSKYNRNACVSFRGHDFHAICPGFTLLNCDGKYCWLRDMSACQQCLEQMRFAESDVENEILRSGATTITEWRTAWNTFFDKTLDKFVVFSAEIAQIFYKVYPQLERKTFIVPHKTTEFHPIHIKPHKNINIAFLGYIDLAVKGSHVIDRMIEIIDNYENVKLKVIGKTSKTSSRLYVTGKYQIQDLPHIMQREQIDIVFIASVAPETFSYTTSEAMSMGIPVACFNFGAPYERVKSYSKGLILKSMDERYILDHIVDFVMQIRKEDSRTHTGCQQALPDNLDSRNINN